jgi:hypothetical protein
MKRSSPDESCAQEDVEKQPLEPSPHPGKIRKAGQDESKNQNKRGQTFSHKKTSHEWDLSGGSSVFEKSS